MFNKKIIKLTNFIEVGKLVPDVEQTDVEQTDVDCSNSVEFVDKISFDPD